MALDPTRLPEAMTEFLTERHLATLTTLRPDGTPHVVAVGFTWDPEAQLVRVITWEGSRKARREAQETVELAREAMGINYLGSPSRAVPDVLAATRK